MQPPARQRGAVSRSWPRGALLHALELVRRRPASHAIAAAPHQANTSAAAHRWRLGDDSPLDSADQRQITSTARACGPAARPRGAGLDTSSKHKANTHPYRGGAKRPRRSISEYRPTKSAERPAHSAPRPCHQCPTTKPVMKITVGTSDRWSRSVLNDHSWKATTEKKRPKTKSAGRQPNRAKRAAYRPVHWLDLTRLLGIWS